MLDFEDGVHLLGTGVFIDSRRSRPRGIVTHAHADHVGRHERWVASPATAALCARRWNAAEVEAHPFHEPWDEDGTRVTLLPAGHILGSSMVLLERAGTRVLYTGDFRLRAGATPEPCEPAPADVLVMECTYGNPRYRFPRRSDEIDRLCEFIARTLRAGATPVLMAYSLGKAQEAARVVGMRGFHVWLHEQAYDMVEVYRGFGVEFPRCRRYATPPDDEPWTRAELPERGALIVPPGRAGRQISRRFRPRRTAVLSGWALDRWRSYGDAAFAISDHADFDELIELVDRVRPRKVHTLHGPDGFARHLRARGFDAEPAALAVQGSLF
jgi:Cft2 family RNA processing exonuclease